MNENNKNEEFKVEVDKEELKSQTKETVNQVKETVKNINFKEDAKATKGFVLEFIKNPATTIKSVTDEKQNYFSSAIMLMICYIVASGLGGLVNLIKYSGNEYSSYGIFDFLLTVINPVLFILAITIAIILLGGKDKKSMTTILSGVIIANAPRIISELLSVINIIFIKVKVVLWCSSILQSAIGFISVALTFLAIKGLIKTEDDDKFIRKVTIIMVVAYAILKVLSICGLY
ncbi:MAG: hypothetical protein J6J60_02175 [Clostridia bacterium]|nr:hypothetical protein [Clostridia bacterium]